MNDIPDSYLIIIALLIAASILSKYFFRKYYFIFKLLPMAQIIYLPFYRESGLNSVFSVLILGGLIFSIAGDVLLLLPDKYFKAGLISFLIAHLFYSYSFYYISESLRYEAFVIYALFGWLIYKYLKDSLGKLRVPVIIYITVISIMGSLGLNQFANGNFQYSFQLFLASILFIISDSVLAINKFRKSFRAAELVILFTYYSSQLLFSASV
jgi:uncharacterized membrane protein YhhN